MNKYQKRDVKYIKYFMKIWKIPNEEYKRIKRFMDKEGLI